MARDDAVLDAGDAAEGDAPAAATVTAEQRAALRARAARRRAALQQLEDSGETQRSRHDPDARRLRKAGQALVGDNVQSVTDDAHQLIVAHAVTNAGNDLGQLVPMIEQTISELGLTVADAAAGAAPAGEALGGKAPAADVPVGGALVADASAPAPAGAVTPAKHPAWLADAGDGLACDIATCQARGDRVFVPLPAYQGKAAAAGRRPGSACLDDEDADVYHCPGGQRLTPRGPPRIRGGAQHRRDRSQSKDCAACPRRAQCLPANGTGREIERSEHAAAIACHRTRMQAHPEKMRQRAGRCDHHLFPIRGTMKRWLGWDHFLVRGFETVRGEMARLVHGDNLRRRLSILGVAGFIAACPQRRAARLQADVGERFAACASALLHALLRAIAARWRPWSISPDAGALRPGAPDAPLMAT